MMMIPQKGQMGRGPLAKCGVLEVGAYELLASNTCDICNL